MGAGGSGITPMVQIIKESLKNPDDKTQVSLVFGNSTPADILMRDELDKMAAASRGQLKIHYVVDRNDTQDPGIKHVGYVTKDFLARTLPAASDDTLVYVCGPPQMLEAV